MRLIFPSFLAVIYFCCTAAWAQQTVPHLEKCTDWNYQDGVFGTTNSCSQPVAIQFMTRGNQQATTGNIGPKERFKTGLNKQQIDSGWWMFTACPVGYVSSITFVPGNKDTLIPSKYNCVRQ
jgi:hypothetical protein